LFRRRGRLPALRAERVRSAFAAVVQAWAAGTEGGG
jgi:hypothetical protein